MATTPAIAPVPSSIWEAELPPLLMNDLSKHGARQAGAVAEKCQRTALIKSCRRRAGMGGEGTSSSVSSAVHPPCRGVNYLCRFCHPSRGCSRRCRSSAAPPSCARSGESSRRCRSGSYPRFPFRCLAEKQIKGMVKSKRKRRVTGE